MGNLEKKVEEEHLKLSQQAFKTDSSRQAIEKEHKAFLQVGIETWLPDLCGTIAAAH